VTRFQYSIALEGLAISTWNHRMLACLHCMCGLCTVAANPRLSCLTHIDAYALYPVVTIAGSGVPLSQNITVLDSCLSLNDHTFLICQSTYFHIRALRHIWCAVIDVMATALAVSYYSSSVAVRLHKFYLV